MAIANRPINGVLNPDWPLYAHIADWNNFADGAGNTATAGVGRNLTLGGVDETAFRWISALGGGAVEILDTAGTIRFPQQSGGALTRTKGSILVIAKAIANTGGMVYTAGRVVATTAGRGACNVTIDGSAGFAATHKNNNDNLWNESHAETPTVTDWYAYVITWDVTGGTPFLKVVMLDPVEGELVLTRSPAPDNGLVTPDAHYESILTLVTGGPTYAGVVGMAVAQVVELSEPMTDQQITGWLADPWSHQVSAFPFLREILRCGRPSTSSLSFMLTTDPAYPTACDLRVDLYTDEARTSLAATGTVASSSDGDVQERLVSVCSDLTPGTQYFPKVFFRHVADTGDWVEIESLSADCDYRTLPTTGTLEIDWYSDPHLREDNTQRMSNPAATGSEDKYQRHVNFITAALSRSAHFAFSGGDLRFTVPDDKAGSDAWNLARIDFEEALLRRRPIIEALGNQDFRVGPETTPLPEGFDAEWFANHELSDLEFMLNPAAASARENYGMLDTPLCRFVWCEPYTGSALPAGSTELHDAFLDEDQWDFLEAAITTNDKPHLHVHIHNPLNNTLYNRVRGLGMFQIGSQEEALHTLLVAARQRSGQVSVVRMIGHNHEFLHFRVGDVDYIECASPTGNFSFSPEEVEDFGYLGEEILFHSGEDVGYVRIELTSAGGVAKFIRTSADQEGDEADNTVVYTVRFGGSGANSAFVGMGVGIGIGV